MLKKMFESSFTFGTNPQEAMESFFGKNSLNVSNVKLFSKKIFNIFVFFMPFW